MRQSKKKSKKPKLTLGAALGKAGSWAQGNTGGLNMAGGLVSGLGDETNQVTSGLGGALSGAGMGAEIGSMFGPIGTGIGAIGGALVGGISSIFGADEAREKELEAQAMKNASYTKMGMNLAKVGKKHGGELLGKALHVVDGGSLTPLSEDAVEVNANNPSQTDSVELGEAFVDHGEVIDREKRVFSNELKMPSGKPIAKEAKRLQKMKSESARFADANEHIETKLDKLFSYQESLKQDTMKKGAKKALNFGGLVNPPKKLLSQDDPKFNNRGEHDLFYKRKALKMLEQDNPQAYADYFSSATQNDTAQLGVLMSEYEFPQYSEKPTDYKVPVHYASYSKPGSTSYEKDQAIIEKLGKGKTKPKFSKGTKDLELSPVSDEIIEETPRVAGGLGQVDVPDMIKNKRKSKFKFDLNKGLTGLATFGPNVVSALAQKRLKGPAAPVLEGSTKLKRFDPSAELASNAEAHMQTNQLLKRNTAQSGNLAASLGDTLSKRLAADRAVHGSYNNLNTQVGNTEATMNQGTMARNVGRSNQFNNDLVDFSNMKQRLTTQNVANLGEKILLQGKERNQATRDAQALDVIRSQFKDSGVLERDPKKALIEIQNLLEEYTNKEKKESKKKGGKLNLTGPFPMKRRKKR